MISGLVNINGNSVQTLQDFDNFSSQMAKVSPATVAYSAVNSGTPTTCPSVDSVSWEAKATPLPNRPSADLCNCMVDSLTCVVKSNTNPKYFGQFFGYICGIKGGNYCAGIANNATTGDYGAYGMCAAEQQLSFVMNAYYEDVKDMSPQACDFSGAASTNASPTATGSCASLVSAAGSNGGGSVPTDLSSGSASSGAGNAAPGRRTPSVDGGILYLGLYILGVTVTGAGMLLL